MYPALNLQLSLHSLKTKTLSTSCVSHSQHECKFLGTRRLVTPLTAAIEGYHNECVETLVSSGADVNFQNTYDKTTPVYLAVHTNQPDVVKYLLQHGADSNVFTTNEHATPLAVALANMAFRFDDAPRTPYIMVDQGQRRQEKALDIIEMLLQHGADMKACQWGRLPPPFLCATKDDTRVMELFLTYGLDVNMAAHPVDCCTPANSAGMWFAAVNDFDHPRRTWNMNEERRILTYYLEAGYYHVAVMLVAAGSDVTDIDRSIIKLNFIGSKGSRGERPSSIASQEDTFYLEALYLYQKAPPPLKIVCRKVIRKTMQVTTDERVKRLPVPKAVQMFLISQGLCF